MNGVQVVTPAGRTEGNRTPVTSAVAHSGVPFRGETGPRAAPQDRKPEQKMLKSGALSTVPRGAAAKVQQAQL